VGRGPCLLQRCQRLDMQGLGEPSLGFLPVHSKRLGARSSSVCSVLDVGTRVRWITGRCVISASSLSSQGGPLRREPNRGLAASNSGGAQ
jgi:hypothetical protein